MHVFIQGGPEKGPKLISFMTIGAINKADEQIRTRDCNIYTEI
jgi:hypothetical protein